MGDGILAGPSQRHNKEATCHILEASSECVDATVGSGCQLIQMLLTIPSGILLGALIEREAFRKHF